MSLFDKLLKRGREQTPQPEPRKPPMTEEEARAKRLALWEEIQAGPSPKRATEIVKEAEELLNFFDRSHPLHDRVSEMILTAQRIAGREQVFRGE